MKHYFQNDETLKTEEKKKEVFIKDTKYVFKTDHGVFSKKGLDFGTRTLLESIDLSMIKGDVLDFGCGYGPVGIFIKDKTSAKVDMIDVNERALKLAKDNALLNDVSVNVFYSDCYENVECKYDFIISNPPIRVGNEILYKILFDAKQHLKNNGSLIIVINKNQGAKTILNKLSEKYEVSVINKNKGFYIIEARNV